MTVDEKKDFEDVVMGRKRPDYRMTASEKKVIEDEFMRRMMRPMDTRSDYERWCSSPPPVYWDDTTTEDPGWITTTAPVIPTPEELEKIFTSPFIEPKHPVYSPKELKDLVEALKTAMHPPIPVDDYLIDLAVEPSQIEKLFFKVWREAEKCTGYNASDWYELASLLKL